MHRDGYRHADGLRWLWVNKSIKIVDQTTQPCCQIVEKIALLFRHDRLSLSYKALQ